MILANLIKVLCEVAANKREKIIINGNDYKTNDGTTIRDLNCERLKLYRALFRGGMKIAAISILCQDERVFQAMMMSNTPCPYKGLIGDEAAKAWEENPEKRPDYEQWKKDNVKHEELVTDEELTGLSIGSLLFLLLLL